jgi:hypothetical protein
MANVDGTTGAPGRMVACTGGPGPVGRRGRAGHGHGAAGVALPVTATVVYALGGIASMSADHLGAAHKLLIWTQTGIGWLAFVAALLRQAWTTRAGWETVWQFRLGENR